MKPGDGDTIRNSEYTALQNREIRALGQHAIIGAIAGRLTRSSEIRLWDDQLVSKPPSAGPGGPGAGWHTDRAYWMTCTSEDMLTAWIPLHDCPVEMGPVIYVDGSHQGPDTESMRTFNSQDLEALERRLIGEENKSLKRVIALRKGQMSFHHCRMIHGSDVNRGDRPRTSIALHLQDGKNRHRMFLNERGEPWHITNDDLCRKDANGHHTAIRRPSPSSGRPMAPRKARCSGPTGAPREVPFQLVMARRPPRPRPEDGS